MARTHAQLLLTVQSDPDDPTRDELFSALKGLLRRLASNACGEMNIPVADIEDIVTDTIAVILKATGARFDPNRHGASIDGYLSGLVRNAALSHLRGRVRSHPRPHDYSDPDNARRGLPSALEDIPAAAPDEPDADTRDLAEMILSDADPVLRRIIERVAIHGEKREDVADDIGVSRRTLGRRLDGFIAKANARFLASVA